MEHSRRARLVRVIQYDAVASVGALLPVVFWGVFAFVVVLKTGSGDVGLAGLFQIDATTVRVNLAATLIGVVVLAWRHIYFQRLMSFGVPASARVTGTNFHRGRGRLLLAFEIEGVTVETWMPLRHTAKVRALKEGDEVEVRYDVARPDRVVIPELFS